MNESKLNHTLRVIDRMRRRRKKKRRRSKETWKNKKRRRRSNEKRRKLEEEKSGKEEEIRRVKWKKEKCQVARCTPSIKREEGREGEGMRPFSTLRTARGETSSRTGRKRGRENERGESKNREV